MPDEIAKWELKYRHKVSILIPTYCQPKMVLRAVRSALIQDYTPLEVIVCDDSRDDETRKAILPLLSQDARLQYIKNESRLGRVGNYRNALYSHASGEWVLMLDGDDYLMDASFISDAVSAIAKHEGIVFVQGGGEIRRETVDGSTELISVRIPKVSTSSFVFGHKGSGASSLEDDKISYLVSGSDYVKMFPVKRYFLHLTTLFHRSTAMQIDFYRKDLLSSDLESFMRLALHGKVFIIGRAVGVWLQHQENAGICASKEDIIANNWAVEVEKYAVEHHLWSKRGAKAWARRVRSRELIGVFMREINRSKNQNKRKLDIFTFTVSFVKKYPTLLLHPVFLKKLMFNVL